MNVFLRILSISALLLAFPNVKSSAERVCIRGYVYDEDHMPVELATINEEHFIASALTDLKGRYEITLQSRDTIVLVFRMIGHETRRRELYNPHDTVTLDVMLPTSGFSLQGVTIQDMRRQTEAKQDISTQGLKNVTAIGGAVESIISTQAGVSSRNEMSNQYNVRGGNFDENSIWVNGTEILRPLLVRAGQQEGLSFINPDMVESISFSTGGFEARYGDRMSSVLDITYRKPKGFESTLSVGLLGYSAFIGTGNDKFSFSGSVRYKTNRQLVGTMDTKGEYDPSFFDYQTYISWTPNKNWDFGFIGNIARNNYKFTPASRTTSFGTSMAPKQFMMYFDGWEEDRFNTMFGALSIRRIINEQNNVSLHLSGFDSDEKESYDIRSEYWLDQVDPNQMLSIGGFREHARNRLFYSVLSTSLNGSHRLDGHHIGWGVEVKHERVNDRMREWELRDSSGYTLPYKPGEPLEMIYSLRSKNSMKVNRLSTYIQDIWRYSLPIGFLSVTGGVRASYWNWNDELIVSPRLSIGFVPEFNDNFTFRFSSGVYYQAPFYKELKDTMSAGGISSVRLNKNIRSQRSIQFILGGDYIFKVFGRPFRFTAEAYYKKLDRLIPYNIDNVRIVYYGENCAKGYAAGIDLKLFGEFVPGTDSWISFSLMRTEEKIGTQWLPRPSDQLYNLSLFFTDYFPGTDRWKMSLRCALADGMPFGPPHSGREDEIFRSSAYRRVDMGMSYRLFGYENTSRYYSRTRYVKNIWLGLDCFNLLDINNVNSFFWVTDVTGTQYAVPNYLTGRLLSIKLTIELGR